MRRDGERRRVLSDEERVLWRTVAKSVKPLRDAPQEPADASISAATAAKPARIVAAAPLPPAAPVKASPPPLSPLGRRRRSRVARGSEPIDGRLDLHGLTQSEAHAALLRFLRQASARGARLVLVITGKGGADGERGVLRRQLPHWLALGEFRALVVGYEQAGSRHGGEGAWYISVQAQPGGRVTGWSGKMAKRAKAKKKKPVKKTAAKGAKRKAPAAKRQAARKAKTANKARIERKLEEGLMETFPGSDPVAVTDPTTIDKRD